ncbi:NADH-quinone oxidoreductase subunit N [Ketogulonicigenium robustum]|uniref:NADH-quinone oxidoreductase subunit N n=1 Tax=Ketogulonicigenium robustum TaxID=92947 RepID=A0A1W6P128_9RHOB|nr:NADH-quinone oxidoreductase subunit NuoN [Ketogulonicigenium robustum]ARO15216.1 NADH-quinone oxidoreductase subunit N [Ketogulonicigenium robustum]
MSADLALISPEIALALFAIAALIWGAFGGHDKLAPLLHSLTAGVLAILGLVVMFRADGVGFGGLITIDGFARFAQAVILLSAAAVLAIGQGWLADRAMLRFEYPVLVALAVLGMLVMVSASDLITLYMGLELQSLALYILAAFGRENARSSEAGLKYFILGALSSGLLLYGASLTYGFAGTTSFAGIAQAAEGASIGLLFGLVFLLAGVAFKISAVPFHMWTPDVYEGAPTPVTAFMAAAPKVAAMAMLARIVHSGFGPILADWQQIIVVLSLLSMFLGAIAGIAQRDIKRLMAYSSIAHMGYALLGLAAGTAFGVEAMLVYMALYAIMSIGAFAFILSMVRDGAPISQLDALKGLGWAQPARGLAVLVLMVSLAGIPPFIGFFGKLYVLQAAIDAGLIWLAAAGVVASVIGAFYYLRIVYLMYFVPAEGDLQAPADWPLRVALAVSALATALGALNLFGLEPLAAIAAQSLIP